MDGAITYQVLSAAVASLTVVGTAWFFIDRRMKDIEKEARMAIERVETEGNIQSRAALADVALLRETLYTRYVSHEQLIRLEERLISELRELRRSLDKRNEFYQPKDDE